MNNPASWQVDVADAPGVPAIVDLAGLLFWTATDASGNQLAYQILQDAYFADVNNNPIPSVPGFQPWPFDPATDIGRPADPNFPWPPAPQAPAVATPLPINPVGTVPPTTGQGSGLLFPPRPF